MRKLKNYYLSMLMIAGLGFMASCSKDGDDPEPAKNPTIEFIGGTGFTSADKTVPAGEMITTKVTAKSNTTSGKTLERFKITVQYNGGATTTFLDSTNLSGETFDYTANFPTQGIAGTEVWTYTITDNAGLSSSVSYTITTTSANSTAAINTFSTQLLGSYGNSAPGFFSTSNGVRYYRNTAVNNQGAIDFVYFYGSSNQATLAAPNDPDANTITDLKLNTWTTKNATTFKTTSLNKAGFDAVPSAAQIDLVYNAGVDTTPTSRANMLAVGDVLAFKTQAGKKGLIYIKSLTVGASGSMTIDVKVQK